MNPKLSDLVKVYGSGFLVLALWAMCAAEGEAQETPPPPELQLTYRHSWCYEVEVSPDPPESMPVVCLYESSGDDMATWPELACASGAGPRTILVKADPGTRVRGRSQSVTGQKSPPSTNEAELISTGVGETRSVGRWIIDAFRWLRRQ